MLQKPWTEARGIESPSTRQLDRSEQRARRFALSSNLSSLQRHGNDSIRIDQEIEPGQFCRNLDRQPSAFRPSKDSNCRTGDLERAVRRIELAFFIREHQTTCYVVMFCGTLISGKSRETGVVADETEVVSLSQGVVVVVGLCR